MPPFSSWWLLFLCLLRFAPVFMLPDFKIKITKRFLKMPLHIPHKKKMTLRENDSSLTVAPLRETRHKMASI